MASTLTTVARCNLPVASSLLQHLDMSYTRRISFVAHMSHATWLGTVVQFRGKRVSIATILSSTPISASLHNRNNNNGGNRLAKYRRWTISEQGTERLYYKYDKKITMKEFSVRGFESVCVPRDNLKRKMLVHIFLHLCCAQSCKTMW